MHYIDYIYRHIGNGSWIYFSVGFCYDAEGDIDVERLVIELDGRDLYEVLDQAVIDKIVEHIEANPVEPDCMDLARHFRVENM